MLTNQHLLTMPLNAIISIHLKRLRKERELTQEELARLADIDTRHYQRLESGEKLASLTTLFKLSKALSINPDELIHPAWNVYIKKNSID